MVKIWDRGEMKEIEGPQEVVHYVAAPSATALVRAGDLSSSPHRWDSGTLLVIGTIIGILTKENIMLLMSSFDLYYFE